MKVLLEYDPIAGTITDINGLCVGTWLNLESFPMPEAQITANNDLDNMIKLKHAGFSAKDIIDLRQKELF